MKINKNPVKSYSELPNNYTEYPSSVPRQALNDKGDRMHFCNNDGWVEGSPTLELQNSPWPNNENRQSQTLHRCRKCNKILAKTGDFQGGRNV